MVKVKAIAKSRIFNGHQFNGFWSGGFHWPSEEATEREVSEDQYASMKRDVETGMPIIILSADMGKDVDFIPASPAPEAPVLGSTEKAPATPEAPATPVPEVAAPTPIDPPVVIPPPWKV